MEQKQQGMQSAPGMSTQERKEEHEERTRQQAEKHDDQH
jgi:hypothetical protein